MHKMNLPKDLQNQKYLTVEDGKLHYQVGRGLLIKTAEQAGAIKHIGRRILIDKNRMDAFLDFELQSEGGENE